ncbi:hypothetical protein [Brevundimonas sp.]|uniref:hypothetical protein n=1 Tax=Brevundimonas sp. TaxID=1871086 RepID=UPI0025B8F725|nr:hypothetical protein [Brevundimonas sp.]
MIPFNATVQSGFQNRDKAFVHWVKPDNGPPVQVKHYEALPEGKRVRLEAGKIEGVQ